MSPSIAADYPKFYTLDYDVTQRYEEGAEVYVVDGKFTPVNPSEGKHDEGTAPIAVVISPPKEGAPDMELMLVAGGWDSSKFKRHKLLSEIMRQYNNLGTGARGSKPARIVVLSRENMGVVLEHCTDVFEPSTREGESHEGLLYGLLVFWSLACDGVRVY